jgi:microcystin-dependent protein
MTFYLWSKTASADATVDPTINWAEGQSPSSINDSARAMMAATAKFRDDISGAIVTGGTVNAYTVSSFQVFDTLAHFDGKVIAFTPHVTNTGASQVNVDGLGLKPLRIAPGVEIPSGTIVQGTPYTALYNNTDGAFYLEGFYGSPYIVPIGATLDFYAPSLPNSAFVFPIGQAISRTVYASLFALIGTYWGPGDGTTTFTLPDLRGRVAACPDIMGASGDAGRLTGNTTLTSRTSMGGVGGEPVHTLTGSEIPTINSAGTASVQSSSIAVVTGNVTSSLISGGTGAPFVGLSVGTSASGQLASSGPASVASTNTGGLSHNNIQPTILCNKIMRII